MFMLATCITAIHPGVETHLELLLRVCTRERLSSTQSAYVLATAHHESRLGLWMDDHRSGWDDEGNANLGNDHEGDGRKYRARGYGRIVGRKAYGRWAEYLGLPLLDHPDLAAEPAVAADILVLGMQLGRFTGRALGDYVNDDKVDYVRARRVMPSSDKPVQIAATARQFEAAIEGTKPTGPTRSDVKKLQNGLVKIGWPLAVDGSLGPLSSQAIVDFQTGYDLANLPIDGNPDPLTRLAVDSCAANDGFASEHFRFAEFRTAGDVGLCPTNRVIRVERKLLQALECYRSHIGRPVRVAEGYRSVSYNDRIGGRFDSEHVRGLAVHVEDPVLDADEVASLDAFSSIGHRQGLAVHLGVGSETITRPEVYPIG